MVVNNTRTMTYKNVKQCEQCNSPSMVPTESPWLQTGFFTVWKHSFLKKSECLIKFVSSIDIVLYDYTQSHLVSKSYLLLIKCWRQITWGSFFHTEYNKKGWRGFILTPGPHLGPRVTQHISVLHIEQRSQSQPHFFIRITWHVGQFIASPRSTISWTQNIQVYALFSSLLNSFATKYTYYRFPVLIQRDWKILGEGWNRLWACKLGYTGSESCSIM
jgi:hypothetical protein